MAAEYEVRKLYDVSTIVGPESMTYESMWAYYIRYPGSDHSTPGRFRIRITRMTSSEFLAMMGIDEENYDSHIAMGSLLRFFRKSEEDFKKGKQNYLKVNQRKSNIFKDKLKKLEFTKIIGISWKSDSKKNKNKSLSLEEFILGIYTPNVCFVNLQYGDNKNEINNIRKKYNIDIIDFEEVDIYNDIDDFASLIDACDVIVSIENMLFALSGAIGIDSKILLTRNCLCFHGINDLNSYWLPAQAYFRQNSSGEWKEALSKIKYEIETYY